MTTLSVEAIQEIVGRQLGKRGVRADDELVADLGVESLDYVNLVCALEEKYGVSVADDELGSVKTVRDLHALIAGKI
jgi:acyl carrier protein